MLNFFYLKKKKINFFRFFMYIEFFFFEKTIHFLYYYNNILFLLIFEKTVIDFFFKKYMLGYSYSPITKLHIQKNYNILLLFYTIITFFFF